MRISLPINQVSLIFLATRESVFFFQILSHIHVHLVSTKNSPQVRPSELTSTLINIYLHIYLFNYCISSFFSDKTLRDGRTLYVTIYPSTTVSSRSLVGPTDREKGATGRCTLTPATCSRTEVSSDAGRGSNFINKGTVSSNNCT